MTHLLDTCTWLRVLGNVAELNEESRRIILANQNAPYALSAISVWEVCLKVRKRPDQISLNMPLDAWLKAALQPRFIRVIPVDAEISSRSQELKGAFHEDPADRFIVATAQRNDLILLTSDEKIIGYPHVRSFDTR